jgi:N,N'-diacetylchitobiose transport system substrate-binding protein
VCAPWPSGTHQFNRGRRAPFEQATGNGERGSTARAKEIDMKARVFAAVVLAVALAVAASTASGSTRHTSKKAAANEVVVWVMTDAQSGWPGAVAAANNAFKAQHPGVDVNLQYQSWDTVLQKFDAALAANSAPDVIELGNSQTTAYMAAGALSTIKAANYPNSKTWLGGLKASCSYNGKLYCVPYYAGARAVIYRKDMYAAVGIKKVPTTYSQFLSDGNKLMKKFGKNSNFSALYEPGQNWYVMMTFVKDWGGDIAVRPNDEAHPFPSIPFAKGRMAAFIGNGWEWPYVFNPKGGAAPKSFEAKMGAYPMPSHIKGKFMPTFLGGSDLAIPISAQHKSLGADWIKAFTSTSSQKIIAKAGNIANTTTLANVNAHNPALAPFARASKYSWFVPTAPNWTNVEKSNVLKTMGTALLTNKGSVKSVAQKYAKQVTKILNAKS